MNQDKKKKKTGLVGMEAEDSRKKTQEQHTDIFGSERSQKSGVYRDKKGSLPLYLLVYPGEREI